MLVNRPEVKSAIRGALRVEYAINADFRARFAADPDCEDDLYHIDRLQALAKVCFRQLNETAGTQDAECIARWLTGPVLGAATDPNWEDQPKWHYAWTRLFYRLGDEDPNLLASTYEIPDKTARRIIEIAAHFVSEVRANSERVEAADHDPLSGWDAIAYADYRWECTELSPLDGLGGHLRYISFDRAWADVIRCTRPSDLHALIQWGRAHAAARKADLIFDEEVNIPNDVRAA